MHAAPSVSYPVGRSPFALRLVAGLECLGFAAALLWAVQAPAFGWRQAAGFAAVAACGGLALLAWLRSPQGVLRFSGSGWQWEEGGRPVAGQAEPALDLQQRMLLRFVAEGGAVRWLWVERESDASHWAALRRAVYSRASAPIPTFPGMGKESPPAGKPPAAEQ